MAKRSLRSRGPVYNEGTSIRQKLKDTYPRLGELLVQRRLVSPDAIEHALALQRAALEREEQAPKIGEILVKQKSLSKQTVKLILDEQKVARGEKRRLSISVEEASRGVVVLKLRGGLEKQTDASLVRVLEKLMDRAVYRIAVDGSHLVSISSYSISSFIAYIDQCRAHGGELAFFNLRGPASVTFDKLNLMPFLSVFDSRKAALDALRDPEGATAPVSEFVSSFTNRLYHRSYCGDIKKLEEDTRLYFMSRANAERGGKKPCPNCKP